MDLSRAHQKDWQRIILVPLLALGLGGAALLVLNDLNERELLGLAIVGGIAYWLSRATERRIRALKIQAAEACSRFDGLVQSTDGIVWEADATSFNFTFVSARAEEILGFPVADWYQAGFWVDHLHPDDKAWAPEYCASCVGRRETHDFEYRFVARDGRTVWLHDLVSVRCENGTPKLLRGLMLDISRRKEDEACTRRVLTEQKALIENALVGIAHLKNRVVVSCNPKFEQIFGYAPGELIGTSSRLFYPSENIFHDIGEIAYASLAKGSSFSSEVPLVRKDHTPFWGALTGKALDPEHPQDGSIWIYADITDRMRAQQEAEKLLRAVEQSPVSIVITDQAGTIEYVNPRFTEVSGYSSSEAIGLKPRLLKSGETPPETYQDMWSNLILGREWKGVLRNRRKNGELFWEKVTIGPMLDDEGKIVHFVAVKEDITQQRQNEEELASYRATLETQVLLRTQDLALAMQKATAAERAKGEFLTQMSHEIRTPMNAIVGFAHLLEHTSLDARQQDYLTKIDRSSKHLLDLINNILDLSKIVAGKVERIDSEFSIRELVARLTSVIGYKAVEKSLLFDIVVDPAIPDRLRGDSLRLNQVLMNLLANAIKFTEAGEVRFRISLDDDLLPCPTARSSTVTLKFTICDTGIGMDEAEQERVFEPFAQGDHSITRKYGGTGLGLSISRELVVLLGGKLSLSSEKGYGSTFSFSLPFTVIAAARPPDLAGAAGETLRCYRFQNVRVLLAEDHPLNQQIVFELLEQVGVQVQVVNNGQDALDLLFGPTGASFDLVLMDIQMPVLDGISAMRAIRARRELADLPIVAMTAHVLAEEKRQSLAAGANDHLGKPFRPENLYSIIAAWIPPGKVLRMPASGQSSAGATDHPAVACGNEVLDTLGGAARFAGNFEKYKTWLRRFTDECQNTVERYQALLTQGDFEALSRLVHSLKGLSGSLGLNRVHAACQLIEQASEPAEAAVKVPAALAALDRALADSLVAIDRFTQPNPGAGQMSDVPVTDPATVGKTDFSHARYFLVESLQRLGEQLDVGSGDSSDNAEACLVGIERTGRGDWIRAMAGVLDQVRCFDFAAARVGAEALRVAILNHSIGPQG